MTTKKSVNAVVAKKLDEDYVLHSISWVAGDDCGPFAGKQLTEGHPVEVQGQRGVRFKETYKGKRACIRYDNRPGLNKLVEEYRTIEEEKRRAREARWAAQRAEEEAKKKPLLDAMYAEAKELRERIPADHVEVKAEQIGDFDGWPQMRYTVDGFEIDWEHVNVVGWASAIWPGALAPFASICIASISREKLDELKEKKEAEEKHKIEAKKKKQAEIAAKFDEAQKTGEPVLLRKWTEDCNDPKEECSVDIIYEYAMPDGTTKLERHHTW